MRANTVVRRPGVLATVRDRIAWRHPEWWALAISAAAWIFIVDTTLFANTTHGGHGAPVALLNAIDPTARVHEWPLMILAMMLPLCVASIQATADRSLWRRRHRAIAAWLCGYFALWLLIGVVFALVAALPPFDRALQWRSVVALAFVVAALWQVSPTRARALRQCHRAPPLAPAGWRATYDCVRYGWTTAMQCGITCVPLMCACWLLGHGALGLMAMSTATLIGLAERYMIRPDQRWLAAPMVVLAALTASMAV